MELANWGFDDTRNDFSDSGKRKFPNLLTLYINCRTGGRNLAAGAGGLRMAQGGTHREVAVRVLNIAANWFGGVTNGGIVNVSTGSILTALPVA